MNPLALVLVPTVLSFGLALRRVREQARLLLVAAAVVGSLLAFLHAMTSSRELWLWGYVRLDATSRLFVALINPIFLGVSWYVAGRLTATPALHSGFGRFAGLALTFLGAANAAVLGNHLLVQWIALEITTLVAAPLIIRPGVARSRTASWHYLL